MMKLVVSFLLLVVASRCQINYRQEMRDFIIEFSSYAKEINPNTVIIPQNGVELFTHDDMFKGVIDSKLAKSVDGWTIEDIFYTNQPEMNTPQDPHVTSEIVPLLSQISNYGKPVLAINYVDIAPLVEIQVTKSLSAGFLPGNVAVQNGKKIPKLTNPNTNNITSLQEAKNFLYVSESSSLEKIVTTIAETDYDVVIIPTVIKNERLDPFAIQKLKTKKSGGKRLIIARLKTENIKSDNEDNISETSCWLDRKFDDEIKPNPNVEYWNSGWKELAKAEAKTLLDDGWDGFVLEMTNQWEYWETSGYAPKCDHPSLQQQEIERKARDFVLKKFRNANVENVFSIWYNIYNKRYDLYSQEGLARYQNFKTNYSQLRKRKSDISEKAWEMMDFASYEFQYSLGLNK